MSKPLYMMVGQSGSGKTTVVNILQDVGGYKSVESYTTRPPRYENETGHTFVSKEEFDDLNNIVAYTKYNNFEYAATKEQVDDSDFYVIDIPGIETFMDCYPSDRPIYIVYFKTSVPTRIDRMLGRGDNPESIISRLRVDEEYDWEDKIHSIIWSLKNEKSRNVDMITLDANKGIECVIKELIDFINTNNKG